MFEFEDKQLIFVLMSGNIFKQNKGEFDKWNKH